MDRFTKITYICYSDVIYQKNDEKKSEKFKSIKPIFKLMRIEMLIPMTMNIPVILKFFDIFDYTKKVTKVLQFKRDEKLD